MQTITNPILPGFNPDPSICRVADDYYIATSTFEWWPGVQIHHSRDLVHWRLLAHALTRPSQLDMIGNPDSGGIWAPCLSHDGHQFYLIYTNVRAFRGPFKDAHNYLVTAPAITGPWSDPVYLNSSGFDPSLFHDTDGRKWLVNMYSDYRPGHNRFAGILLQEYSPEKKSLVGPIKNIFKGSPIAFTEGPHLYRIKGRYYLLVAEGGTSWEHSVTLARSNSLEGPFEIDPHNPLLTSNKKDHLPLQKAGHASIVETQTGEWYMVHLCGRPLHIEGQRRCMLGRETAIQKVQWTSDGWLRLANSTSDAQLEIPAPNLPPHRFPAEPTRDDFNTQTLSPHFATLRMPADDSWLSLKARPGFLRIIGRESMMSRHHLGLVARRLQSFRSQTTTATDFSPSSHKQLAGLTAFYDVDNFYYLYISRDENLGRVLFIMCRNRSKFTFPLTSPIRIPLGPIHLRALIDHEKLQFSFSLNAHDFRPIGPVLDSSQLSDETTGHMSFTGAMIGLTAQDLDNTRCPTDFDYFDHIQDPL